MNKSKTAVIILALILILSSFSLIVSSETQKVTTFSISSVNGVSGKDVKISVNISADSDIAAASIVLKYDKIKLEVISATQGTALTTGITDVNSDVPNAKIIIAYVNVDGLKASGSILDVTFRIKQITTESIPLTLDVPELINNKYEVISHKVENGSIKVMLSDSSFNDSANMSSLDKSNYTSSIVAPPNNKNNSPFVYTLLALLIILIAIGIFIIYRKRRRTNI